MKNTQQKNGFEGLGISPNILQILESLHFSVPTPIQHKAIPIGIEGQDLIGIAQTGTGKTLAFAIPMIQSLARTKGQGLVIVPTRELALQVHEEVQKIGRPLGAQAIVLIGGAPMGRQISDIKRNPHIIIATPGRLIDHMNSKTVSLEKVNVLVLDEADRMLDMGFAPQIERIIKQVPHQRQTMLFSATIPDQIMKIAQKYMKLPLRVEVAPSGTAAENVEQELYVVRQDSKLSLLATILAEYKGSVLVFSRTKYGAKRITHAVNGMGHKSAEIHSNRSLAQRREALDGFKNGKYRVLIATDIAARGIDVKGIELVINYDLPDNAEDYVHRIGRTGRAGHAGTAISFATPQQRADVMRIEQLIRRSIPASQLPATMIPVSVAPMRFEPSDSHYDHSRSQRPRRPYHSRQGVASGRSRTARRGVRSGAR